MQQGRGREGKSEEWWGGERRADMARDRQSLKLQQQLLLLLLAGGVCLGNQMQLMHWSWQVGSVSIIL